MITKKNIRKIEENFKNGLQPKLPETFWYILLACESYSSNRKEPWYGCRCSNKFCPGLLTCIYTRALKKIWFD